MIAPDEEAVNGRVPPRWSLYLDHYPVIGAQGRTPSVHPCAARSFCDRVRRKLAPGPRSTDDRGMRPFECKPPHYPCTGLVLGVMLAAGLAAPAWGRSEKILAYSRDQVWPTAVRFLAVDEHVKITEKDAEAGYVIFELRDDGRVFRGSLEVATMIRDGRSVVRFILQIADRPSWLETAMLGRLESKLRAELGSTSPPPSEPPPPRKAEPGKDGAEDGGKDGGKDGSRHDDGPPVSATP